MIPLGVQLERDNALSDAKNFVDEYGVEISIYLRGADAVFRGGYNSLATKNSTTLPLVINAYPVEFSPTDDQMEKAGLREKSACQIYTAYKDWIDNGYTIRDINQTTATVDLYGERYLIKEKNLVSMFADSFLYLTMGLAKE